MAKRKRRPRPPPIHRDTGTPETQAKLRPCPLAVMVKDGDIRPEDQDAGYAILEGRRILTAQLDVRCGIMEVTERGIVDWNGQATRLVNLYGLWLDEMKRRSLQWWPILMVLEGQYLPKQGSIWRKAVRRALEIYQDVGAANRKTA